jgi:hypothetical protein
MTKFSVFICSLIFFFSCNSRKEVQDPHKAKELYSDGMKILDKRISIQSSDRGNAMEFNKKAIEKFSAAYNADTTFTDALLFASECTMFGKDYQQCLYWTTKLMLLDTTQQNINFCKERIEACKKQIALSDIY